MDFQAIIQNISSTSFNLVVIFAAVVISAFYTWFFARDKILSILFATYFAYGFIFVFPYSLWTSYLNSEKLILFKLFLFIIGIVFFSLILVLTKTIKAESREFFILRWVKSVLFALAQLGLFVSILMTLIPADWLLKISFSIQKIFISPLAKFIWFVAPLIILIITKHSRRRGPGRPFLG